ncbi:MAG: translocase [Arcobacter sp.]|uniref:lipopolysaccharide biosynthesis protein n=1 Tax=uncultured Arcobacter sp. TaxID=165434 RepID=UPI000CA83873|nr:oligosaccharide flippase family protein [uncultured Arcobacter sp.]PLY10476.1 MAG: translocase [Arcobacter sp.]
MTNNFLKKTEFRKHVLTLLTGTTISQAIPVAISPILTRIYSPEDFGLLAIYISIVTILATVIAGAYDFAIVLPKHDKDVIPLLQLSFLITSIISIIVLVIVTLFNNEIMILLNNKEIGIWLYFLPLSIFLMGIYQTISFWLNRHKYYKQIATTRVIQSGTTAFFQLLMGVLTITISGLITGRIIGQVFSTWVILRIFFKKKKILIRRFQQNKIYALAKRYKRFPLYETWSNLLNSSSTEVPVILITSLFSIKTAGFYALANRILLLPLSLLGSSIGQVFLQKASETRKDIVQLKLITQSIFSKLVYIGVLPIGIIMIFGDVIFAFIFGNEWKISGEFSQVLALWLFFVFITSPLSNLLIVLEKQKESLFFNILIFISRISSIIFGFIFLEDAYLTVALFGIVGTIFWIFLCGYILRLVKISLLWALLEIVKTFVPTIIILSFMRGIIL